MKIILECLNEPSFSKCLDLDSRITIGRQIPPKSLAEPTNGIFDSKVLSRYHVTYSFLFKRLKYTCRTLSYTLET